ncbi:hypothetical protein OROHE_012878 [Orobanche hederae]
MCIMPQKVTGRNWISKYTKLLFLYLSITYDGVWYDTAAFVE